MPPKKKGRGKRSDSPAHARKVKRRSDGSYAAIDTVTVSHDEFSAALYEPDALEQIRQGRPGFLGQAREAVVERHYVVSTRRAGRNWEARVETSGKDGVVWEIPSAVLDALIAHRQVISAAQRSDQSREAAAARRERAAAAA